MREYDIEAMQEILEEHGITAEYDKAKEIAEDFILCYQSNREHESPIPDAPKESDYERAERLQRELNKMNRMYSMANERSMIYETYIRKRSGAIAVGVENGRIYFER